MPHIPWTTKPIEDDTVPESAAREEKEAEEQPVPIVKHTSKPLGEDGEEDKQYAGDEHTHEQDRHMYIVYLPICQQATTKKSLMGTLLFLTNYAVGGVAGAAGAAGAVWSGFLWSMIVCEGVMSRPNIIPLTQVSPLFGHTFDCPSKPILE